MQLLFYVQTKSITSWKNLVHGSGLEAFVYSTWTDRLFLAWHKETQSFAFIWN